MRTWWPRCAPFSGRAWRPAARPALPPSRSSSTRGSASARRPTHNLTLLRHLRELTRADVPLLAGLSRKSLVGKLTGRAAGERTYGSVALAVIAAMNGARIIRAHDVAATVDALKVVAALEGGG